MRAWRAVLPALVFCLLLMLAAVAAWAHPGVWGHGGYVEVTHGR